VRRLRALAALPFLTAACCAAVPDSQSAPVPQPVIAEAPVAAAPPSPPVVIQPTYDNWTDAPQTGGDWIYASDPGETFATFGTRSAPMLFLIRCDRSTNRIGFARPSPISANTPMRIQTETAERLLTLAPRGTSQPLLAIEIDPNDRLLDAIALSRGRFAVETAGMETLYLPAWPEITRVVEDCR